MIKGGDLTRTSRRRRHVPIFPEFEFIPEGIEAESRRSRGRRWRRSTETFILAATMRLCKSNPGFCRKIDIFDQHAKVEIVLAEA